MSARAVKKTSAAPEGALTRADLVVREARGRERMNGGIEFSGVLYVRNVRLVAFENDGDGGCNVYRLLAPTSEAARAMMYEVEAFAKRELPTVRYEQLDTLIGALWDEAIMRGQS